MADAPTEPVQGYTDPGQTAIDNLDQTLQAAPELQASPGAATNVSTQGGNIPLAAQATAQAGKRQNLLAATQAVGPSGVMGALHDLGHLVTSVPGDLMKAANAPLSFVQHEYKYLHDVEARHGLWAALGEGAVLLGAAAAGTILTGGLGDLIVGAGAAAAEGAGEAALGAGVAGAVEGTAATGAAADVGAQAGRGLLKAGFHAVAQATKATAGAAVAQAPAGGIEGQVMHRDSWDRTASNTYVDPHTHQLVSFGRDIASGFLHLKPGSNGYKSASGVADGIFDLFGDPLQGAGHLVGDARSLEGMHGIASRYFTGRAMTVDNIDTRLVQAGLGPDGEAARTFAGNGTRRALDFIAQNDAGAIQREFPTLEPLIYDRQVTDATDGVVHTVKGLASAGTPQEVGDILRRAAGAQEMMAPSVMPSMSPLRAGIREIRQYAGNRPASRLAPVAGFLRRPVGTLAHLTTREPGVSFDPATKDFPEAEFHHASMVGAGSLQAWLTQGLGIDAADKIIDQLNHADNAGRLVILRNAFVANLFGHADMTSNLADLRAEDAAPLSEIRDPKFRQSVLEALEHAIPTSRPEGSAIYASTLTGEAPPPFIDPESGVEQSGAVLESQRGVMRLPDYNTMHRMGQQLRYTTMLDGMGKSLQGVRNAVGSIDDIAYKAITNPIKKMFLSTGGYAARMALAELIPNTLRLGLRETVNGAYHAAVAALERGTTERVSAIGDKMVESHLEGTTYDKTIRDQLALWINDRLGKIPTDPTEARWAMMAGIITEAHGSTRGLAVGHNLAFGASDESSKFTNAMQQIMERHSVTKGDKYTMYPPESEHHLPEHQVWLRQLSKSPLSREIAQSIRDSVSRGASEEETVRAAEAAAKDHILHRMDPVVRDDMIASKLPVKGATITQTPIDTWAHMAVENVRAATHSPAHIPNERLLANVAKGEYTSKRFLARIDPADRPLGVPGRVVIPHASTLVDRLTGFGFEHALNPVIQSFSRTPLFLTEFIRRMHATEKMVADGLMTEDVAATKAASSATFETIKFIHNTRDRVVFDRMFRNWAPFFFAQEQAYRRMGRLLVTDPGAFRQYQLMVTGAHNLVSQESDSAGNRYVKFPGSGWLSNGMIDSLSRVLGIPTASVHPTGFGGTLTSANVIFPLSEGVRPDLSPLVVVPMKMLNTALGDHRYSAWASGALQSAIGPIGMSQSIPEQLIPNQIIVDAVAAANNNGTTFQSVMLQQLATLDYEQRVATANWVEGGRKGPEPQITPGDNASPLELQDYVRRVENQTRISMIGRAILEAVSPLGSEVTVNDFGLHQDLQNDINSKDPKTGQPLGVLGGFQKFIKEHPYATAYTTSQSQTVQGVPLKESVAAADWYHAHQALITAHPGALWLMPQSTDSKYSPAVYQQQVADHLRSRDTPIQYLQALYTSAGDSTYYESLAVHEANIRAAGNNRGQVTQEYANWDAYMQQLQKVQPIWWANYNNGQKAVDAVNTINDLRAMFADGTAPPGTQTDLTKQLLDAFDQADAQYQAANSQPNYSTLQKQIRLQWQTYLGGVDPTTGQRTGLVAEHPQLQPIIASVFHNALTSTNQS